MRLESVRLEARVFSREYLILIFNTVYTRSYRSHKSDIRPRTKESWSYLYPSVICPAMLGLGA